MARDLILGTAGHIDHGKTTLVKALTGVDCDRLPEEKARGITIDIGFARLDLGDYRIGIVDVPGHERFVKNMLAGATGIDVAVLVVSAKESVKPQTREHLEILRLLGIRHGVIAMTMCDLADADTRELVELEVRELVQGSFLAEAPMIQTAAISGMGIDKLREAITACCEKIKLSESKQWFRLPIDRSFSVAGHGTVVTGSVVSGTLKVGDEVDWLPSGQKVRVRSIQNHDQAAEEVHRGQRAAINLAGVHHSEVVRGQELATPGYLMPSRVVTVRLHCLASMRRPVKHRQPVRFHAGTQETMGTVSLLDCDTIEPGQWGLAQLFLEGDVTCTWGQPFVLRESSATETVGGGQVLQPAAKKVRRRHLEVLERIEKLWTGEAKERALVVAWFGGFGGTTVADYVRGANMTPDEANAVVATLKEEKKLRELTIGPTRKLLLHGDMIGDLEGRVLGILDKLHEANPLMSTHDRQRVQSQLDYVGDDVLVNAAVEGMIQRKVLIGDQRRLGRADFKPKLSTNLRKLKEKMIAAFKVAGFQPPEPQSFAPQAGGNASNLKDLFDVCVAEGHLAKVNEEIYLHADADAKMRQDVKDKLGEGKGLTVAEIRDMLGTTRKYAVPLCEYLDRIGLTRREGDLRFLAQAALAPQPASTTAE
jgi:selenocysteine-specific elongation factor